MTNSKIFSENIKMDKSKMSSSLSELRNFRLNKGQQNGGNSSSKLASGRKRIRAMSDSSDDEHADKHSSPQKPVQNGKSTSDLSVKEKEERFHLFRETIDKSVDSLTLQDILARNDWDVQKAYDAIQENPKLASTNHSSPAKAISVESSPSKSPSTNVKEKKQSKVKSIEF